MNDLEDSIFFSGVHISDDFIFWKDIEGCIHQEERGRENEMHMLRYAIRIIVGEREAKK